ncbi:MAG: zinc-dependent metalloprotease [Chloroherpetonaceae bacterium]|nr:zinc-dependent metalloprotease [Chloroherpetonaceae bacterium]
MKCTLTFVLFFTAILLHAQPKQENESIAAKTAQMTKLPGLFNLYWESKQGKLWMEIEHFEKDILYYSSLPVGVGSNDLGLDRGQLGSELVVRFQRIGNKVLLIQQNLEYRAITKDSLELKAVEESFAKSVIWGFEVALEEKGRILVDATQFFMRDVHGVAQAMRRSRQGAYQIDISKSAFYLPNTKSFPNNTEVETILTFVGSEPGGYLREVVPTPENVTVRMHHSLVLLPDINASNAYKPRAFDPRAGYFPMSYMDFATPIDQSIRKRFITRHRLEKKNPTEAKSEALKPIIYYLDSGTPEPVRSALLEGARWWNEAFEAAGFINAFRVELLPTDADPMDVRYNVIQWVHRSSRGWSYGASITDPRTGEILKGKVTLGSLRVRQDYLIAEAFLSPYSTSNTISSEMKQMALARLRQLSAHEVGHTLGLAHNYFSSIRNRSSVMDYPHPYITLKDGKIRFDSAYSIGIGEWDKISIRYGYESIPSSKDEKSELKKIITEGIKAGQLFLTDQDARPFSSSHPLAHLWDNGSNPADELKRLLQVREVALRQFSESAIQMGEPLSRLEEPLVPLFLAHRYQVEACAKLIAGESYSFKLRGDDSHELKIVPRKEQLAALESLLLSLEPKALTISESILKLLPPQAFGYNRTREYFPRKTGDSFDPVSAAEVSVNHVFALLLNEERLTRLVQFHARNNENPSLLEVLNLTQKFIWDRELKEGLEAEIGKMIQSNYIIHLGKILSNETVSTQVKAEIRFHLLGLKASISKKNKRNGKFESHQQYALFMIEQSLKGELKTGSQVLPQIPPGQPIGIFDYQEGFGCHLSERN